MRALIRLYPRQWRERYGVEFGQLIADLTARQAGGVRRERLGAAMLAASRKVT
jgi:hypothetical protein